MNETQAPEVKTLPETALDQVAGGGGSDVWPQLPPDPPVGP